MPNSVFPLLKAYPFGESRGLGREIDRIRKGLSFPPGHTRRSSVRRGYMIELFDKHGLLDEFIRKHWPQGRSSSGQTRMAYYRRLRAEHRR